MTQSNVSAILEKLRGNTASHIIQKFPLRRDRMAQTGLLLIICALLLMPVWVARYPPLVDYPNHLARYFILAHLKDSNSQLTQFYRSNWGPYPYVALDIVAVALQRILPIYAVGRLILSACVLGVPLAAYFFLRQVNPANKYLGLWALMIAYGPVFLLGSLNDVLSEALCFLFLGLWLQSLRKPRWCLWLVLFSLGTLLYFTHLVGFAVTFLVVLTYSVLTRQPLNRIVPSLSVFIPGALVHLGSFASGTAADYGGKYQVVFGPKLLRLLDPFRGYTHLCVVIDLAGLIICAGLASWKNPELKLNYPWLGVIGALLFCYFLAPQSYHFLDRRIAPFLFILAICVANVGRRGRVLAAIALLVFGFRCADFSYAFFSQQAQLERLTHAIAVIPPHSRVLTLKARINPDSSFRQSYLHFWAYGVIDRGWFSPFLFHTQGIHPLAFRLPAYIPATDVPENVMPDWQLIQRDYDYLWVYNVPRFSAPISAFAELVYSNDVLRVFKVRTAAAAQKR